MKKNKQADEVNAQGLHQVEEWTAHLRVNGQHGEIHGGFKLPWWSSPGLAVLQV